MIALLHVVVTTYLLGLIWTIQVVHYPSFAFVDPDAFVSFHQAHNRWISAIVMVPMLAELALAGTRAFRGGSAGHWVALACVLGVWVMTFAVIVPVHTQLAGGYNAELIRKLVQVNWPRTLLWTGEWIVVVAMAWPRGVANAP